MSLSTEDIITLLRTEDLYDQKYKQFMETAALDPTHAIIWLVSRSPPTSTSTTSSSSSSRGSVLLPMTPP